MLSLVVHFTLHMRTGHVRIWDVNLMPIRDEDGDLLTLAYFACFIIVFIKFLFGVFICSTEKASNLKCRCNLEAF
jgi:hypothetical protein